MAYYRIKWERKDDPEENGRGAWFEEHDKKLLEKWVNNYNNAFPELRHTIEKKDEVR